MAVTVIRADYDNPTHAKDVVAMLDICARDPMGGGEPLSDDVRSGLIAGLKAHPTAFSILAYEGDTPIGLANCFFGFSTFAAKPLVNIHDMVVDPDHRGKGVGKALFGTVEDTARQAGACKVTLEVLNGNHAAKALYTSLGYGDYALDPATGTALFWQKKLM